MVFYQDINVIQHSIDATSQRTHTKTLGGETLPNPRRKRAWSKNKTRHATTTVKFVETGEVNADCISAQNPEKRSKKINSKPDVVLFCENTLQRNGCFYERLSANLNQ